jgi:hypothetical protein
MNKYDLINKEWILSPTARLVYRTAAIASLMLVPVVMEIQRTYPVRPFLRQLLLLTVVGTALNLVGMEYFLFRFDESHAVKQILWFCVMLVPPFGPALYCLVVYSRSGVLKRFAEDKKRGSDLVR